MKNSAIPKNASVLAVCGIHHRTSLKEMVWLTKTTLLRLRMTLLGVMELNLEVMKLLRITIVYNPQETDNSTG